MKRLVAVLAVTAAASLTGLVGSSAQAASICVSYDVNVNGQGQADSLCLPE